MSATVNISDKLFYVAVFIQKTNNAQNVCVGATVKEVMLAGADKDNYESKKVSKSAENSKKTEENL